MKARRPPRVPGPIRFSCRRTTSRAGRNSLGSFNFTGTIPAGGSITRTQSINIPFSVTGERFVIVHTDTGNAIVEHVQDADNTTVDDVAIEIIQSPFPNLQVSQVTTTIAQVEIGSRSAWIGL